MIWNKYEAGQPAVEKEKQQQQSKVILSLKEYISDEKVT